MNTQTLSNLIDVALIVVAMVVFLQLANGSRHAMTWAGICVVIFSMYAGMDHSHKSLARQLAALCPVHDIGILDEVQCVVPITFRIRDKKPTDTMLTILEQQPEIMAHYKRTATADKR